MKRVSAALAVGILVSLGLTGCNGGDGSAYCNRVRDNAKNDTLNSIDPTSEKGLQTFLAEAKKLQADAPTELHLQMAASVMMLIPILILYFFTQKHFQAGILGTGSKG